MRVKLWTMSAYVCLLQLIGGLIGYYFEGSYDLKVFYSYVTAGGLAGYLIWTAVGRARTRERDTCELVANLFASGFVAGGAVLVALDPYLREVAVPIATMFGVGAVFASLVATQQALERAGKIGRSGEYLVTLPFGLGPVLGLVYFTVVNKVITKLAATGL